MAFTTEFVMGAGGTVEVEEIPVSMSGSGSGNVHPLTTVNAGTGAWVWVDGEKTGSATTILNVGAKSYGITGGTTRAGGGGYFTGNVTVAVITSGIGQTTVTGAVYVTRL